MGRFDNVRYDEVSQNEQAFMKDQVEFMERRIATLKAPRYKALALTALEECYMWIGKAIRDDQIERSKNIELQEDRGELTVLNKKDEGVFQADLCPYKAPEQIQSALRDIKGILGVSCEVVREPYNKNYVVRIYSSDHTTLLRVEEFLMSARLIK
jgi:hypothetical protein